MPSWSASDFASRPPPDPPSKPDKPPPPKQAAPAPPKPAAPAKPVAPAPTKPAAAPPKPAAISTAVATETPASAPDSGDIDLLPRAERPQTAAPPQVRTDFPVSTCQMCGYAFKGKPLVRCPECSGPMQTGASDLLKFSSKGWLHTVTFSMTLVIIGIALHVAGAVLRFTIRPAAALVHPAASLLLLIAVFLATRHEKRPFLEPPQSALFSRIAAVGATILWIIAGVLFFKYTHATPQAFRAAVIPLIAFSLLADAALAICFGFYTHQLAGRLPDDSLSLHTLNSGFACAAACLLFLFFNIMGMANPEYFIAFFCAFPAMGLCAAALAWPCLTLFRLAAGLRHAAKDADMVAARRRAAVFNSV